MGPADADTVREAVQHSPLAAKYLAAADHELAYEALSKAATGSKAETLATAAEAPAPAGSSVRVSNLPAELTRFVGRRNEASEVKRLLSATRLVTLTGVGGVGKTRLVSYAAADLRRTFRDGIVLVELADLPDPALLGHTVASALGRREQSRQSRVATLIDFLGTRHVLLMLDNCEHLLDACACLSSELLRACRDLRVLAQQATARYRWRELDAGAVAVRARPGPAAAAGGT
jgi:non-specific serine/threonine protein kinase